MNKNWLLTLSEISANDLPLVGLKSLNLATVSRNNLATPPGLVVTTAFFESQIEHYAFGPIWTGSPDVEVTEGALEFLADFLKTTPLAPQLETALKQRLGEVFPADVQSFAARSSAVDEDRRDYSFAGHYLTELGVPRSMLTVSLTRCWASALTGKAVQYRIEHGMPLQSIRIAVLIQPMLTPDAAGVAFTLNPVTGARDELVIEASAGLGEAIVSGRVNPYRYRMARQSPAYPIIEKVSGDAGARGEPLSSGQLFELGQVLEQTEALMGSPQDVEWAYQGKSLYILQTRPITGAEITPSARLFDDDLPFNAEWTRANHPDTLPDIPSPLFVSLMERTQDKGAAFFNQAGIDVSGMGPYIRVIYGRPYLNLSMIKRIFTRLGLSPIPLLTMAGYMKSDATSNPFGVDWKSAWRARESYQALLSEARLVEKTVAAYQQTTEQVSARLNNTLMKSSDLLSQFKLRERVYSDLIGLGLILVSTLSGLTVLIAKLIAPLTTSPSEAFSVLGTLGRDPFVIHHNQTLLKLSQLARTESQVQNYLAQENAPYADYQSALAGAEFLTEFEAYLDEFGYRAVYESDMAWPRFSEQPSELLQTISRYIRFSDEEMAGLPSLFQQSRWQILKDLSANASTINRRLPWRQALALPPASLLNKSFALRTAMYTAEAQAMDAIRRWDLALAEKWRKAGLLEARDDYFWLTMEEIENALVTGRKSDVHLKPIITARKATYQAYAKIAAPFVIKEAEIPLLSLSETEAQEILADTLTGLPVSSGQVQGVVAFLDDLGPAEDIPKGRILVAPSADPAYLPYFPMASGLIVEVGGMLSHGSIIAREYHLPAVSSITDARQRLRPGDKVLVDGSTGVVQVLERASG